MLILAHADDGRGWGGPVEPWELHPALTHFPIAFLLGGVVLDAYAWWRGRPDVARVATGLLVAGVLTGLVTALAGILAFYTVPGHTQEAHRLMYWHGGLQAASLVLFAVATWARWRDPVAEPGTAGRFVAYVGAVLLLVGSAVGGYIVYHGGAGVAPELLAPEVRHGHSPGEAPENPPAAPEAGPKHDHH